jgi:FMN phosphatase YigB (HAD superfamily)
LRRKEFPVRGLCSIIYVSGVISLAEKRKTLVLFDVGGVLLALNFQTFYDRAAALAGILTPGEFKSRYVASRIDFLACKGLISRTESVEMLRGLIGPREPVTDDFIESLVQSCWSKPIGEIVELKRRVHEAGYAVGILSNITELALAQISTTFPELFDTFDESSPRLYSCRLGAMKPELAIYAGVDGYDKVIFIDDKELYVEVPVRFRGWKGIWLTPWIDEAESLRAVHDGDAGRSSNVEGMVSGSRTEGSGDGGGRGTRFDGGDTPRGGRGGDVYGYSGNLRRADSVDELRNHLRDFGVDVT